MCVKMGGSGVRFFLGGSASSSGQDGSDLWQRLQVGEMLLGGDGVCFVWVSEVADRRT